MAKSDKNNTFGDSKKIKLSPDRQNLKPVDPSLSFDQYLYQSIQEGHALLAEDAKKASKTPDTPQPSPVLQDALAKMSDNPYVRARVQLLNRMTPKARSAIEEMEKTGNTKNDAYSKFVHSVTILGDKLSSPN